MQDKEKDYETIYNELQEYLVGTDDDYKLQVYDELLQTGSVTVFDEEDNGHYFSFREFRHEILDEKESIYEPLDLDELDKLTSELLKSDQITEVDIDVKMLDLETHEIDDEPDYQEMTDDELLACGINPDTKERMSNEFVFKKVDDLIDNSQSFINDSDDSDCNRLWIEDVYALKYIKSILEYYFAYTEKKAAKESDTADIQTCRKCGCTNDRACPGGCYWVEPDLCSSCAEDHIEVIFGYFTYENESSNRVQFGESQGLACDFNSTEEAEAYIHGYATALGLESAFENEAENYPCSTIEFCILVNGQNVTGLEFFDEGEK